MKIETVEEENEIVKITINNLESLINYSVEKGSLRKASKYADVLKIFVDKLGN